MATGAHIVNVGAVDCFDASLLAAVNTAIRVAHQRQQLSGDTHGDRRRRRSQGGIRQHVPPRGYDRRQRAVSSGIGRQRRGPRNRPNLTTHPPARWSPPWAAPRWKSASRTLVSLSTAGRRPSRFSARAPPPIAVPRPRRSARSRGRPAVGLEPATPTFSLRTRQESTRQRWRAGTDADRADAPARHPRHLDGRRCTTGMLLGSPRPSRW